MNIAPQLNILTSTVIKGIFMLKGQDTRSALQPSCGGEVRRSVFKQIYFCLKKKKNSLLNMCFLEAMFIIALMFSLPFIFVAVANIKYV